MCGIVGVLHKDSKIEHLKSVYIFNYIYKILFLLQTRGYDSVGICSFNNKSNEFKISKFSVDDHKKYIFDLLKNDYHKHEGNVAIGHTRLATNGEKNDKNAHPHLSFNGDISVVHNGIISNYNEIMTMLESKKFKFNSKTDSEVIPNYLEFLQKVSPKDTSFNDIIGILQERLEGKWACLILHRKIPNTIFFCKKNMPLCCSKNLQDKYVLVSDPSVFIENSEEYYFFLDPCHGYISQNGLFVSKNNYQIFPLLHEKIDDVDTSHIWTLQNLDNTFETIHNTRFEYRIRNNVFIKDTRFHIEGKTIEYMCLEGYKNVFSETKNIVLVGTGTSYHNCLSIKYVYQEMEIFDRIDVLDASEFNIYDLTYPCKTIYIVVSQSSENKFIENFVSSLISLNNDAIIFGIFNNQLGQLTIKKCKAIILLNSGKDFAYSFVKSFISQYCCMYLLGNYIAQCKSIELSHYIHTCKYMYSELLEKKIHYIIKNQHIAYDIAKNIVKSKLVIFLGKGNMYPICLEAANKVREISYIDSVGLSYHQLKVGYMNIIDENTPIFILINKHKNLLEAKNLIQEIRLETQRCPIHVFTNENDTFTNYINNNIVVHYIQDCYFLNIVYLLKCMYIAYYLAFTQKIHPDRPKISNKNCYHQN